MTVTKRHLTQKEGIRLKLSEILPNGSYHSLHNAEKISFSDICEHTNEMRRGDVFIARRGARFDPLLFLSRMEAEGICALILEKGHALPYPTSLPLFYVEDIERTIAEVYDRFYGNPAASLTLIGITGTNGKTTTARILSHLLQSDGIGVGYIGTLGVFIGNRALPHLKEGEMTTPSAKTVFRALQYFKENKVTHVIMEVSSHALIQKRVLPLFFEIGIFMNLSEDHLDYHGDMESYFTAKASLFSQCKTALINRDDPYGERLLAILTCETADFGILHDAAFRLTDLHEKEGGGANYTCVSEDTSFSLFLPLIGRFNLYNSLAAVSAARLLGVSAKSICGALPQLPPIQGRMERLDLSAFGVPFNVFIDYAHTPDAMEQCLKCARTITKRRLYAVFGAGGEREREKRSMMGVVAERYADFIILTADNSRMENLADILHDIINGMTMPEKRHVICNRADAIRAALGMAEAGDTVLLIGKGHEEYMIDKSGKHVFSERGIVFGYFEQKA